jgi:hypothetical protein
LNIQNTSGAIQLPICSDSKRLGRVAPGSSNSALVLTAGATFSGWLHDLDSKLLAEEE